MDDQELLNSLRNRRADPALRIDMKTIPTPDLFPPATAADVGAAEEQLRAPLPTLLAHIYLEVGNGGFGPGAGLLGIRSGYTDSEGKTLPETYAEFVKDGWPRELLPLFDWGDAMWSCVELQTESVVTRDGRGATRTDFTLKSWLEAWTRNVDLFREMYETVEKTILNPFTKTQMQVKTLGPTKGRPWVPMT